MAVTLADVARLAGVSPATVSRVINDSAKKVAPELRERVLAAVAELHYVPNAHAQSVARPRKSAVGVIVHDVSDPYFAEITRGLQRQAAAHDRLLVICNSYREPERELAYVALLRAQQVHALILAGSGYHDDAFTARLNGELNAYQQGGGRVAVIGRHELVGSAVLPANESGAYELGCRLLTLGHRRIGVIAGPRSLTTTTDRLSGIRRALAEAGTALPPERIVYADFTRDGGAEAAGRLLGAAPDLTAIVALNDSMAVGTLATLREHGIAVPARVSVAGFDDMPIARDVTPALTTVRLPLVGMGERAMALALADDTAGVSEPAAATLIWRESCAAPA
ncbi:LacI family transcriptional regulator [Actinoplanes sp. SE50]|uniref:LacI family DNA-binding transcriptional regulator n=1 Tax=unclassified Actinoplanes TaxID=2626549 RepID=UPI00023EBD9C|nr:MULTISPECIES: LacI family DNA-binding transcriptional regulator [unclassified Actinoplanes]AEV86256.1 LacI family transcriptional regulator [Actinoplanes sp. SE50/110]ATO84653.1 LacI family transcriptional regulator [Actinoplanes sp. SE50]SLM02063.1 LacI family transcriptional regulator [Actinoplanes sp. SE50/110]